uniref:Uncharacterized protein n=1 Tax=Anguilla anguilla TaxID=7936 RepID=A0A0E9V3J0_ANGAN
MQNTFVLKKKRTFGGQKCFA